MPAASKLPPSDHTLYLVDLSSFIFRAYFAIRAGLKSRKGEPTHAVLGVATMLARIAEQAKPRFMVAARDAPGPSFRDEMYPEYKANRSSPPDDLLPQFARVDQLLDAFEFPQYGQRGVEADDIIGTLATEWIASSPERQVVIVSNDKDLMQLVGPRVRVWDTMGDRVLGEPEVEEKFGVGPGLVRDYLALVGDSSDNIPGVSGIGPKGAAELLKAHGSLEGVLKAAQAGGIKGKKGEAIAAQEKQARLSAQLATVKCDVKLDWSPEKVRYQFHLGPEGRALFEELDFQALLERWTQAGIVPRLGPAREVGLGAGEPEAASPSLDVKGAASALASPDSAAPSGRFHTVDTETKLGRLLERIDRVKEFGFDLETTSLNPRLAEIVGVAVSVDGDSGHYVPVGHEGLGVVQLDRRLVMERLKPFLEDPRYKKVGQNLKYDWSVLYEQGVKPDGIGADTMVASYVLEPEGRHNLKTLAARYLDYAVLGYEEVCGKGKAEIPFSHVPVDVATRYSAEDAWIARKLWEEKLRPQLERERLMEIFAAVDMPLVDILCRMERQGVCIDADYLKGLSAEYSKDLARIEERVQAYAKNPVNLNSPRQLAHLLFEELRLPTQSKTKTGYSTDADVLEALGPLHEVPRLLLEYREIAKLKGTYVDPLPMMRDPKTGKIHAGFHQTVAATGRLSSADPNLQNIPIRTERGMKIRRAFIPCPGNELLAADYSQIELRVLAHMSGDPDLRSSFQREEDVHRRTASEIFGVKPEAVSDSQRSAAKAINFGLMYGKGAFSLAQELGIPRREAQDTIDRYFSRYKEVKAFLDRLVRDARETGVAHTLLGRRRILRDINAKNPAVRAAAERMAMNTPIQGTAADLMKLAMIEIDRRLEAGGYRSRLIIQVHDEVLLDCPEEEVVEVQGLVRDAMEHAMTLSVPLKVNSAYGRSWYEV